MLKSVQTERIKLRDQLLYFNLLAIGGLGSIAIKSNPIIEALLILPFITFVLGWTYIANDRKVTQINRYLRIYLRGSISKIVGKVPKNNDCEFSDINADYEKKDASRILGWEVFVKLTESRTYRKAIQTAVEIVSFICSGFVSILAFVLLAKTTPVGAYHITAIAVDTLLLLILTIAFIAANRIDSTAKANKKCNPTPK